MCDGLLEVSDVALMDALREIITLNGELRKLRADTEAAGERRKQEYASHVFSLTELLASKDRQLAELWGGAS